MTSVLVIDDSAVECNIIIPLLHGEAVLPDCLCHPIPLDISGEQETWLPRLIAALGKPF